MNARKTKVCLIRKFLKSNKYAKKYGFYCVYLDECSTDMLEKYVTYIRSLLTPTCEYVKENCNGKQFQKLTDLLSILVFEVIGKYIHPTLDIQKILKMQSVFY